MSALVALDIEGFKSFAKPVHISFGPGITGFIGPNGSGKSNIAEAIRWVLGEQSTKALRAVARTDVLYSGPHTRIHRALVTLTFDNESGRFPIDAGEVAMTRMLSKDGESTYTINGEDARLIDIQRTLARAGIGTKGYAVISQGTVDQYLQATPIGRRELFDEATGIKPLKIDIATAHQKLARAKNHADEIRHVLSELNPQVVFLRRQIDQYDTRDAWQEEFRTKQHAWYVSAWHTAQQDIQQCQTALEKTEQSIQNAKRFRIAADEAKIESIASPRDTTPEGAWALQARNLLRASHAALAGIAQGKTIEKNELRKIVAALANLLDAPEAPVHTTIYQSKEYAKISAALERAREEELACERAGAAARIALQTAQSDMAMLNQEIMRECGTEFLSNIPTMAFDTASDQRGKQAELRILSEKISSVGERDHLVVKEYEEASSRAQQFSQQLHDIEKTMADIERCISEVTAQMHDTFARQFERINASFQSFFIELFGGGEANITQTDEGIDITAAPGRKRARHISLLSGGERALTSLALLLAILDAQEPPFIVLDEVDAALDEANSRRFAVLLQHRANATQCIVITHNRETMTAANVLYGVTMHTDGISRIYSLDMQDVTTEVLDVPAMQV